MQHLGGVVVVGRVSKGGNRVQNAFSDSEIRNCSLGALLEVKWLGSCSLLLNVAWPLKLLVLARSSTPTKVARKVAGDSC
eukprot:scaffold100203_cov28-Tisochrysis_lutea.AAC.1